MLRSFALRSFMSMPSERWQRGSSGRVFMLNCMSFVTSLDRTLMILGTAAKMFIISGPVIVYGISSGVVYGILLLIFGAA